jgi:type III pantothenate kinase
MIDNCLLDLGNTRYKWMMQSELPDGEINKAVYAETMAAERVLRDVLEQSDFQRLIVASVRDSAFNREFSDACRDAGVSTPEFISIGEYPLIPLAYQNVSRFGIDRYLDLVGATQRYQPPFIVVDAGTVVTFDAVDKTGAHIGGCIHPGRRLLSTSLIQGTDRIVVEHQKGSTLFAGSTEAGINGGVEQGFVSAVDGILAAMQSEFDDRARVILTGGDADWLLPLLGASIIKDSTILFEGIQQVGNSTCRSVAL